jgi:hypothetical protein
MPEPVPTETRSPSASAAADRDPNRRPSLRNRTIFERRVLGGETLAALATEYNVTHHVSRREPAAGLRDYRHELCVKRQGMDR